MRVRSPHTSVVKSKSMDDLSLEADYFLQQLREI